MLFIADGANSFDFNWATLIGSVLTALVSFAIWWFGRKRPNRIQVREVEIISLLSVAHSIRSRLAATFDGQPVLALSQSEYVITNRGSETVSDIEIDFRVAPNSKLLHVEALSNGSSGARASAVVDDPNRIAVSIPFLNPHKDHGAQMTVRFVCDGPPYMIAAGDGKGWSVDNRFVNPMKTVRWLFYATPCFGLVSIVLAGIASWNHWSGDRNPQLALIALSFMGATAFTGYEAYRRLSQFFRTKYKQM